MIPAALLVMRGSGDFAPQSTLIKSTQPDMDRSISSRTLGRIGQIQVGETATAFLMFAYSFLAMASYNAIKPITRSKFIDSLGADNLPYVQLAAGVLIGMAMVAYGWLMARLPRRWSLPIVQGGIIGLLVA